ncbi:MAG: DUF1800 domain-containing protein [Fimbriimonadaceae bacterium]|nr:DUF1800 domain-containing protein [Fimbriimonadaceae bacterium]
MNVSRRAALGLLGGSAVALAGCDRMARGVREFTKSSPEPPRPGQEQDARFLNRFGYGPRPSDVAVLATKGREAWLDEQLRPGDEPLDVQLMVRRLDIEQLGPWDLRDWKREAVLAQMQQKAIIMATYSPWQLRERMVDFWTNHFNIYTGKGLAVYRKPMDEREVVRKHALGKFPDMVRASSRSTAMLVFLDQQNSTAAHPNENYARELLELHTLGVHGGYTQKDVMEVARCLTGYDEERGFLRKKGSFVFRPELHDNGEKVVLGHRIPAGGGESDGDRVVEIVTRHPATARFIAQKLCRFFLGDDGKLAEEAVAEAYRATDGDIPSMIKAVASHPAALGGRPVVKRPFDYLVSALRATDAQTDGGTAVQKHLADMGQPLYQWPMPDGFPDRTRAWTGSLLGRWNFAFDLLAGRLDRTSVDAAALLRRTGLDPVGCVYGVAAGSPVADRVRDAVAGLPTPDALALALAAPEFQWR